MIVLSEELKQCATLDEISEKLLDLMPTIDLDTPELIKLSDLHKRVKSLNALHEAMWWALMALFPPNSTPEEDLVSRIICTKMGIAPDSNGEFYVPQTLEEF